MDTESSEWSVDINLKLEEEKISFSEEPITKNEKKIAIYNTFESKEERSVRFGVNWLNIDWSQIAQVGLLRSKIKNQIVIEASPKKIYGLDTLLITKNDILGKIDDVFGNITQPLYSIVSDKYLNDHWEDFQKGEPVYTIETHKQLSQEIIHELTKIKGSDASNKFDEEVMEEEQDFSDDEKEKMHKQKKFKPIPLLLS